MKLKRHARHALAFVAMTTITACGQIAAADAPSVNTNTPNSGAAIAGNAFATADYCQRNPSACTPHTTTPATDSNTPTGLVLLQGTLVSDQCFGECSVADGNEHGERIVATATNGLTRSGGYLDADAIPYFVSDASHLTWHEQRDIGATCAGTTQSVTFEFAQAADGSSSVRKTTFSVGHCNPTPRQCLCVYEF